MLSTHVLLRFSMKRAHKLVSKGRVLQFRELWGSVAWRQAAAGVEVVISTHTTAASEAVLHMNLMHFCMQV
jgi:hypothetical protein